MLPFAIFVLFASSAFAAPGGVSVNQYAIDEFVPLGDNGKLVSSYLTERSFEFVDGGDTNIYILSIQQILDDLANQHDALSQSMAMAQTVAVLGEMATGVPGDSCEAAALVDAYAFGVNSGNFGGVRQPLTKFIGRLLTDIDLIVQLSNSPNTVRYSTGKRSNCVGSGRSYQFEAAWDAILASAGPQQIDLINEEYCAAKRLYNAFNIRSNNVGAVITASSTAPVTQIFQNTLTEVANFLRVIASGNDASEAAGVAKAALSKATASLKL